MSDNKLRYYNVTQTFTVQALNQADAMTLVEGGQVPGKVLQGEVWAERISAGEARDIVASNV